MKKNMVFIIIACILVIALVSISLLNNKITGDVVTENSLIVHYKFDGDMKDSSGNNNHASLIDGEYEGLGKSGKALKLDGIDDYVKSKDKVFDFGSDTDFTISFWIKSDCTGGVNRIIDKSRAGSGSDGTGFSVWSSVENIYATLKDSDYDEEKVVTSVNCITKDWYFITVVANRKGNLEIYKNGIFEDSKSLYKYHLSTDNVADINNDIPLAVGRSMDSGVEYFGGSIDEIKIWNYALTKEQIVEEYNSY